MLVKPLLTGKELLCVCAVQLCILCRELSRFIAVGRLNCRIDKVGGVVETNRPDSKNFLYQVSCFPFVHIHMSPLLQSTIKQGDLLLNRIQKLSRVINM